MPPSDADARLEPLRRRGATVLYRQSDVTNPAEVARFVDEAAGAFGGIDICIGNAGIVERGQLIDLAPGTRGDEPST
jgi:NAD(P)-dependent dehydrogenase (short-subunit alcohol dehydrogenase family)